MDRIGTRPGLGQLRQHDWHLRAHASLHFEATVLELVDQLASHKRLWRKRY